MGPIANIDNRTWDRGKSLLDTAPLHINRPTRLYKNAFQS